MGLVVFGSMAQPRARTPPEEIVSESNAPNGSPERQGRLWERVALSVRADVPQAASVCQGGTQVTTRQTIGPRQATFWWHWPYRNPVHPTLRLPHDPRAQPHRVPLQDPLQMPLAPHPQEPHEALQST
jgi:hypothetical protein